MFDFLHDCKSSAPPTWEMLGPYWENRLLFENSALIHGVLDEICTFGIQTGKYGICIHIYKFHQDTARDTWRCCYEMLPCQGE